MPGLWLGADFSCAHARSTEAAVPTLLRFSGERGTLYTALREWFFASALYRVWIRVDGDISFHTRRGRGGFSTSAAMKEGLYVTMPATVSRRKERS